MSGLSLEALNDIGHRGTQLLIVLNDNEMSISPTVGAFSKYLSQIKLSPAWQQSRTAYDRAIERLPIVGGTALELSRRFRKSVVNFAQPGQLFEDLGITYIGVVPGHDLPRARADVRPGARAARAGHRPRPDPEGPRLPPGRDRPGRLPRRGPAADDRGRSRRARTARTARPCDAGRPVQDAGDGRRRDAGRRPPGCAARSRRTTRAYFSAELIELARADRRIVAITAGMPTGTGLNRFQAEFPDRFFDVGIAEQHAVAMATGLAMGGQPAGRRDLLDVPPASVRPDRPRRLPERPAGPPRGRPGRPRRRGRHEPPGDVHAAGPAPDPVPRHRQPEGRAGAALAAPHRARPGPPVRAPLPARSGLRRPAARPGDPPDRPRRDAPRGLGHPDRRVRADRRPGGWPPPTRWPPTAGRSG